MGGRENYREYLNRKQNLVNRLMSVTGATEQQANAIFDKLPDAIRIYMSEDKALEKMKKEFDNKYNVIDQTAAKIEKAKFRAGEYTGASEEQIESAMSELRKDLNRLSEEELVKKLVSIIRNNQVFAEGVEPRGFRRILGGKPLPAKVSTDQNSDGEMGTRRM